MTLMIAMVVAMAIMIATEVAMIVMIAMVVPNDYGDADYFSYQRSIYRGCKRSACSAPSVSKAKTVKSACFGL